MSSPIKTHMDEIDEEPRTVGGHAFVQLHQCHGERQERQRRRKRGRLHLALRECAGWLARDIAKAYGIPDRDVYRAMLMGMMYTFGRLKTMTGKHGVHDFINEFLRRASVRRKAQGWTSEMDEDRVYGPEEEEIEA